MPTADDPATKRPGRVSHTVAILHKQIVSGAWPVGSRIPTEPELTELIGVGRNTVREAVQSLVHAGLLSRRQGSGTYVTATSELATAMTRQLADARQRDVLEVRLALETATARLAARRRTEKDIATLRALQDARSGAVREGDLERMVQSDLAMHHFIAHCSRNDVLEDLYATLLDALTENIRFNFEHQDHDDDSHHALAEAIANGDETAATREIEHYLEQFIIALPD